jgi:hypothetical protein
VASVVISLLVISIFINFHLLSLSLVNLAKGLSIFLIFSKNQLLVSLILCITLLVYISLMLPQIFIISFLLVALALTCSFFPYDLEMHH